jgi:hypothetical protein
MKSLVRSIACAICRALGGQPVEPPPDVGTVAGSSPRTSQHTPSTTWVENRLPFYGEKDLEQPTYNVDDLIQHLKFRITIHETYWGLVEDDPVTWAAFGSVAFQQWAIEGYENAIFYLKRLEDVR